MKEMKKLREILLRLSCIGRLPYQYDPAGQIVGEGPIHYLVEFGNLFFIAWENSNSGTIVINPITRFGLDELDELGAAEPWTVVHVPENQAKSVQFREIDNTELSNAYCQMVRGAITAPVPPPMHTL